MARRQRLRQRPAPVRQVREGDCWAGLGRSFDFITKRNSRKQDKAAWVARAEAAGSFTGIRPYKRVGVLDLRVVRDKGETKWTFWLVFQISDHLYSTDAKFLRLLDIELQG